MGNSPEINYNWNQANSLKIITSNEKTLNKTEKYNLRENNRHRFYFSEISPYMHYTHNV